MTITTPEQMREAAAQCCDMKNISPNFSAPAQSFSTAMAIAARIRAIPIAPHLDPVADGSGPGPHYVADMLSQFVASVWHLLDNSETSGPIDDPITTVMQSDFNEVSKWLDRFESLPSGSTSHLSAAELVATYLAPQPVAVTVKPMLPDGLIDALRHQRQIDMEGTEVAVSRQACDEAADILSALTIHPADPLSDPRVVALVDAARGLLFAHDHGNGLEGWYNVREKLRAALRAIGGEV